MDHFERCFSIFRLPKHQRKIHFGEETISKSLTAEGEMKVSNVVEDGMRHSLSCRASDERGATDFIAERERKLQYGVTKTDLTEMLAEGQANVHHSPSEDSETHHNSSDDVITGTSDGDKPMSCVDFGIGTTGEDWVARRVDFIITPQSQYSYALMGWIGSRMFNRSIRDYSNKEMNMTLTSHGLFDKVNVSILFSLFIKESYTIGIKFRQPFTLSIISLW